MGFAGGRISTTTQKEFNSKWLRTPPPRSEKAVLNCRSQALVPWYSPRVTGTLWEDPHAVPGWLRRDQKMLEKLRDRVWPEQKQERRRRPERASTSLEYEARRPELTPKTKRSASSLEHLPQLSRTANKTRSQAGSGASLGSEKKSPHDASLPRNGSLTQAVEERRREIARQKGLKKNLRTRMQRQFTKTTHLPIDLWLEFRKCDDDGSGRIDYKEFCDICDRIGLTDDVIGETGKPTLFSMADRDGSGAIDFSEFLNAIVGNLVSV